MLNAIKETSASFVVDDTMVGLAQKSLVDAVAYLDQLVPVVLETSSLLRSGDDLRAQEAYITVVGSLESFTDVLCCINTALQVDINAAINGKASISDTIASLNAIFQEMVRAQENYDWVMLADLLEYELVPNLDQWKEILPALA